MVLSCNKFCQDIFIIKKLFYNVIQTSSDMLYFPIVNVIAEVWGWYRCQNRIEKCYQYYWEQLTFYQKKYKSKHKDWEKKNLFDNSNSFDKNRTQDGTFKTMSNATFNIDKLQVTLLFAYIFPERIFSKPLRKK